MATESAKSACGKPQKKNMHTYASSSIINGIPPSLSSFTQGLRHLLSHFVPVLFLLFMVITMLVMLEMLVMSMILFPKQESY